jgi:uncharacterized protein YukE
MVLADSASVATQYGPLATGVGGVSLGASIVAVVKLLYNRVLKAHEEHVATIADTVKREQDRADKADRRAEQYEAELKASVRLWFEQVSPSMTATARALDTVTEQLRHINEERRH